MGYLEQGTLVPTEEKKRKSFEDDDLVKCNGGSAGLENSKVVIT